MKQSEWIAVAALLIVTALTVAFGSPSEGVPHGDVAQAAGVTPLVTIAELEVVAQPGAATVASTATAVPAVTPLATSTSSSTPTSTSLPSATPTAAIVPSPTTTPFPFDTRPDLERFVYVDQQVQHMYVFERGVLVRDLLCSTGLPTPTTYTEAWEGYIGKYWGTFFAFGTYQDDAWYLYPSLGSILVHSLPYTEEDGYRTYQGREFLGVQPSSHGCIRLAPEDAGWFTRWNPEGAYMVITDPYLEHWQ